MEDKILATSEPLAVADIVQAALERQAEEGGKIVYVVKMGQFCKVGVTSDFPTRMISLRTGSPVPVEELVVFVAKDGNGLKRDIHAQFQYKKTKHGNDWFLLDNEDIRFIQKFCENWYWNERLATDEQHVIGSQTESFEINDESSYDPKATEEG